MKKHFLIVAALLGALAIGALFPLRSVDAQFIDRIVRGCSGGIVTQASVIINPNGNNNVNITPCTGGSLTVNGVPIMPGTPAPVSATYITQTPNATLTNEQALSLLATGILKSTTATGVVSIAAAGVDYQAPGNYITALTGDGTAAGPGSVALTLASVVSAGSCTACNLTIDAKGRVTAKANGNQTFTSLMVTGTATSGISIVGTFIGGTGTAAGGLKLGSYNGTLGGFWSNNVTPSTTNYALVSDGANTGLNTTSSLVLSVSDVSKVAVTTSAVTFGAVQLLWTSDNTTDIGASGATRPRTGYFGTALNAPTITAATALVTSGTLSAAGETTIGAGGINTDGGGFKHARVTTGSVSAGSTTLVTITWGTAFADANYTVNVSVVDSTMSSLSLSVVHIESISASAVTVRVLNNAIGSLTGTVHVIAVHD